MKALTTLAIKATIYNQIRKRLYKRILKEVTPAEKVDFFDRLFNANIDAHALLNQLKKRRKQKAAIQKARLLRSGDKPKKQRMTKAQWEAHQKEMSYVVK